MLCINGLRAHLAFRFTEEECSRSDGWRCLLCFSLLFLLRFTKCRFRQDIGEGGFLVLEVTGHCGECGLSHPGLHDWALPSACPCQSHPLVAKVGGLLFMSELLWTLTFIHDHLGMRQLKASGELGFIGRSHRGPARPPFAFLGRSAPHPRAFLVAVPALSQSASHSCTCVWKTPF